MALKGINENQISFRPVAADPPSTVQHKGSGSWILRKQIDLNGFNSRMSHCAV
jgi:hypothetical protein